MNAVFIILGLALVGIVARLIGWSRVRSRPAELGFVSHQWVAEHRLSQGQDRQR
jgi:hypothetical protein